MLYRNGGNADEKTDWFVSWSFTADWCNGVRKGTAEAGHDRGIQCIEGYLTVKVISWLLMRLSILI